MLEEHVHELPEDVVERLDQLLPHRGVRARRLEFPLGARGRKGESEAAALAREANRGGRLAAILAGTECDRYVVRLRDQRDLLVIENVGNLVCPAEFKVGEDARVMVSSVTEGEEKPLKYPLMFRACELVLVNKVDLLPHLDFNLDKFLYNLDAVHPGVERMLVSAKRGDGIQEWRDWLVKLASPVREMV